jgi:hypothetical protein
MPAALPIILYTPYFSTGNAARQAELDECLRGNAENGASPCAPQERNKIPMSTIEKMHASGMKLYRFPCAARCF